MTNETKLISVPVQRHTLFVADAAEPYVPLRPICDALGIDWKSQHTRVMKHPALAPTAVLITTVASDGKAREMTCLSTDMVPAFLMMIHPDRVTPRARETLIAFQQEAGRLLFKAWYANQAGMPVVSGRPTGDLLERIEGAPSVRNHPDVALAIAIWEEAGRMEAAAHRQANTRREDARRLARRWGLAAHELKTLVDRDRRIARRDPPMLPGFDHGEA